MDQKLVSPSILSADFTRLADDIYMLNRSRADMIHCDVMDGVFVPNISFGIPVISQISKISEKPLDVHLMIINPDQYVEAFRDAGAEILTIHYEACTHLHRSIERIKRAGMKAGICLNPHTPVMLLEEIINDSDMILLMSVNPGFGGQYFIENTYQKVSRLKELILRKNSKALIEIDGGVNFETGKNLYKAGADILVSGSFIFQSEDPGETIKRLKEI